MLSSVVFSSQEIRSDTPTFGLLAFEEALHAAVSSHSKVAAVVILNLVVGGVTSGAHHIHLHLFFSAFPAFTSPNVDKWPVSPTLSCTADSLQ